MALVAGSRLLQERSSIIQELGIRKCPPKTGCKKMIERICRIWRSLREFFSPKYYQKKLQKRLNLVKNELSDGQYQKKIEGYYKKFIQEVKDEILKFYPTLKSVEIPFDTLKSIQEFSGQFEKCQGTLQGKLLILPDCFQWKNEMVQKSQEAILALADIKVKNDYEHSLFLVKKAKQLALLQSRDVKSYSHFMREFGSFLSESILRKTKEAIQQLDQEKNKRIEKYRVKKKVIQESRDALQAKKPSALRLNLLNEQLELKDKQIKAIEGTFSDLYGEWLKGMNEIKTKMPPKICSENIALLAFWQEKLHELLNGKKQLDSFIKILAYLDRIFLCLDVADDSQGKKLIASGLEKDMKRSLEAFVAGSYERNSSPKIADLIKQLITNRFQCYAQKSKQFLPKPLLPLPGNEKLISELEASGLICSGVKAGPDCFFEACVQGIQSIHHVDTRFKKMSAQAFRKTVYEYMKEHPKEYYSQLVEDLHANFLQLAQVPNDSFESMKWGYAPCLHKKLEEVRQLALAVDVESLSQGLKTWLITQGGHEYLKTMGNSPIFPSTLEMRAASDLLNVPIRIYSEKYPERHVDIGEYDKTKALHLLQSIHSLHMDVFVIL